jgi:pimeloyl-ACP methyl ester carboxylesterase
MSADPSAITVVLVHGAWADGSSWSRVISILLPKGIRMVSAALPLTSLADDVSAVNRAIAGAPGPVVLAAHSWGGTAITQAGIDPKVVALVYIAAFANKVGQSGGELVAAHPSPPALSTIADDGHGFLRQTEEGWVNNLAPDLPAAEAKIMAVTQVPLAAASFNEKAVTAAWMDKPTWYAISSEDRVVNVQMQHEFAKQMNAKTTVINSSHVSILSHPAEVAAVIADAVATVSASAMAAQ